LNQYAGRLHRLHELKKEVIIYDYVDPAVPMLAKMFKKRVQGYKAIGYEIMNKGTGIE
jgi:superfamily II DNA or RNA helicase